MPPRFAYSPRRRDARVAESGGLENRYTRKRIEGSNPSLSAIQRNGALGSARTSKLPGEVSEWLKEHGWKPCKHESASRVRIPLSPPVVNNLIRWGCSSVGRAPRSQRGGHRFDPGQLHHRFSHLHTPQDRNLFHSVPTIEKRAAAFTSECRKFTTL